MENTAGEYNNNIMGFKSSTMKESSTAFGYLSKVDTQQLADFIFNEHPQTIALILAHMDVTEAADTISHFQDELRYEVTMRIANIGNISPSIIRIVSDVLEERLKSSTFYGIKVGGTQVVADILNHLTEKASKATLVQIRQQDEKLATLIKQEIEIKG